MPCYTVNTVGIELGKMPLDTLERALVKDGHSVQRNEHTLTWFQDYNRHTYNATTGKLEIEGRSTIDQVATIASVKQSFSRQLVREQARKFGWQVREQGNKFVVVKRTI